MEHGVPILFIEGRLGHATTEELEAVALQHVAGAGATVTIDLSGVEYLSGAALKVFKGLSERLSTKGARLSLRAPSPAARLALELAGLLALVDS
jgi:anti-anti-sigma factor